MKLWPHPWGATASLCVFALAVVTYAGAAQTTNFILWAMGSILMAIAVYNDERIHGEYFVSLILMGLIVLFSGGAAIVTGAFPTAVFGILALTMTVYAVRRLYTRPEK